MLPIIIQTQVKNPAPKPTPALCKNEMIVFTLIEDYVALFD